MSGRRSFTNEFKIQVVREYLGGMASRAAVSRQYDISPDQLKIWQKRYEEGKLADQPGGDPSLYRKIAELERMVGRLALENDLLKKADAWARRHPNGSSSANSSSSKIVSGPSRSRLDGGAL